MPAFEFTAFLARFLAGFAFDCDRDAERAFAGDRNGDAFCAAMGTLDLALVALGASDEQRAFAAHLVCARCAVSAVGA
jgi:hypothetical protein